MPGKPWTEEQKQAARDRVAARQAAKAAQPEPRIDADPVDRDAAFAAVPVQEPVNLFSGDRRRFELMGRNGSFTDPIPGFRLYAFLDTEAGMRISQALQSGWQFVDRDEVVLNDAWNTPLNTDLGSHVRIPSRQTDEKGNPIYHYVMKQPLELAEKFAAEREQKVHAPIERALLEGSFNMTAGEKRYTAQRPPMGSPSGLPPISISSKLSR